MAIDFSSEPTSRQRPETLKIPSFEFSTGRVSSADRKFFIEQLALLLETGNSLIASLEIIVKQIDNRTLVVVIEDIIEQINKGKSFSIALSGHPKIFSQTYVTLIEASEEGGYMGTVLNHIIDMEEKREELQNTLTSAFTYPIFLIAFALVVIIFILAYVFPKFTELFVSIEDELPIITLFLMRLSELTINYWWAILAILVVVSGFCIGWLNKPEGKQKLNDFLSKIPLLGEIILQIYLIQTMRVIGLSLHNGVSLMDAITSCQDIVQNSRFLAFIENIRINLTEGRGFSAAFLSVDFIPILAKQMIQTGDESGQLALVSSRIADYYQRDLNRRLQTLSKMIEPAMLLVMGVVVGLIVSSLILPIFKLSSAVH